MEKLQKLKQNVCSKLLRALNASDHQNARDFVTEVKLLLEILYLNYPPPTPSMQLVLLSFFMCPCT